MWKQGDTILVFEPALREVEFMTSLFDSIVWIGYDYGEHPRGNARSTTNNRIQFVLLPKAIGGVTWLQKLKVVNYMPEIWLTLVQHLRQARFVHTRTPSLPGMLAILYSTWDQKRKYWHKYAGNWRQLSPPVSYGFQRWLLKRSRHFVTVNGRSAGDSKCIHSFENPCFSQEELDQARLTHDSKLFAGKLNLLFVGRIEFEKGALSILKAYQQVQDRFTLTLVGGGKDMDAVRNYIEAHDLPVSLTGYLSRAEINQLYVHSHVLVLPTVASEGFPKVISEAAGFGCIPMVTAISVISEYIHHGVNGFLLSSAAPEDIVAALNDLPEQGELKRISDSASEMAGAFTYERYRDRIANEFLT